MSESRATSPYSLQEKAGRLLWAVVQATLFAASFHSWYGWRRALLVAFGARLAPVVRIRRSVRIECPWNLSVGHDTAIGDRVTLYCLGPVSIGARVTISQCAHLCAGSHDFTRRAMPLLRPSITVADDAWICADAFVGPGVMVGSGAVLGARGVAMRALDPWTIYAGNPAVAIRPRPPFVD